MLVFLLLGFMLRGFVFLLGVLLLGVPLLVDLLPVICAKVTDQMPGDSGQKSKVGVKGRGQRPTGKGRGPPTLTRLTVYRLSEASVRGPKVGETGLARPFCDSDAKRSDAKRRQASNAKRRQAKRR